jgi:hypothetical protein
VFFKNKELTVAARSMVRERGERRVEGDQQGRGSKQAAEALSAVFSFSQNCEFRFSKKRKVVRVFLTDTTSHKEGCL